MTTLADIEFQTRHYADAHHELAEKVRALTEELQATTRRHMAGIKRAVERAAGPKSILIATIEGAPELFEKPRTFVFHGVKVGLQKGRGTIKYDDADHVLARIRKHYAGKAAEALIHVAEEPDRKALEKLSAEELKKLGCQLEGAGDHVLIKPSASDVEKVVSALLKEAGEIAGQEAA